MKRRMLSLLLALLLAAGLLPAACAEDAPVTLSILLAKGAQIWDETNPALLEIQRATKVKLEVYPVDSKELSSAINKSMATMEPCDIIVAPAFQHEAYYDSGLLLELTDLLNAYGPTLRAKISEEAWEMNKVDGKIYCIPYENISAKYVTGFRKDWLVKVGVELKDEYTLSELKAILTAFAQQDPDGNGKDDTYGLNGYGGTWNQSLMAIFGAFGGQPGQYYLNGDQQFYAFNVSDDFRAALTYVRSLWVERLIDPEFFVAANDQKLTKMVNSQAGYFSGWWSTPRSLFQNGIQELTPEADFQRVYITSDDGKTQGMLDGGKISREVLIASTCKHPEAAVAFLDYLMGDGYMLAKNGVEGLHYEIDSYGAVKPLIEGTKTWIPLNEVVNDKERMIETDVPLLMDKETDDQATRTIHLFQRVQYNTDGRPLYTSIFYGIASTQAQLEYGAELETFTTSKVVEFITGETPITDETWSAYCQEWVNKGGQKVLESYAEAYNKLHGTAYTAAAAQ